MSYDIIFTICKVPNHKDIKESLLNNIAEMGTHSLIAPKNNYGQSIANSDWHLAETVKRPYYSIISPIIDSVCDSLKIKYKYTSDIELETFWFQQYKTGDFHTWHNHSGLFSCVYYVDISDKTPKTSFNILGEDIEINVNEGDILVFPTFIPHQSKPNLDTKTKTIIAFNLKEKNE